VTLFTFISLEDLSGYKIQKSSGIKSRVVNRDGRLQKMRDYCNKKTTTCIITIFNTTFN